MKETHGDLIDLAKKGSFDVIVHGCNCFCTMGAGIAAQIKREFPEAYQADVKTAAGAYEKMGTYTSAVSVKHNVTVCNAYTQFGYGSGNDLDLKALRKSLQSIAKDFPDARIGLPQIGAGLAGGNWSEIFEVINQELGKRDVTVVYYKAPKKKRA